METTAIEISADTLVGRKTKREPAYLVFEGRGVTWKVLKRYGKSDKDFARWFLATSSPYTYGEDELGDGYVRDVVLHGWLTLVDGRRPTVDEEVAIERLRIAHETRQDPMKAMGF